MGERTIYFLFTDTGTNLSRLISYCTKESLNHVSIGFDKHLTEVYSFGRKYPKNPFIGGFVREDVHSDFLKQSNCAVYALHLTDTEFEMILDKIKEIEAVKDDYRYNFLGLIGVLLEIEIHRKNKFFCSQFVATVLSGTGSFPLEKSICFITPADIREQTGMHLIYTGRLDAYN